jgi:hypothetical protein
MNVARDDGAGDIGDDDDDDDDDDNDNNRYQNKINRFIPSEHSNVYNNQHPSMTTCFGLFLDYPHANIYL